MSSGDNDHEVHSQLSVLEFRISALKEQVEKGFLSMGSKLDNFVDFQNRHDTASVRSEERIFNIISRVEKLEKAMDELQKEVMNNTISIVKIISIAAGASAAGAGIFSLIQFLLK
jgi:hypothetical protein